MAKFTKLNIGDSVASGGGRVFKKLSSMLQLSAPTLSIDGDTLTITDDSGLATSFDVLVGGEVKGTATSATFDLSTLSLSEGTYSITAIAKAEECIDSAESNAVSWTYSLPDIIGTWVFNDTLNTVEITGGVSAEITLTATTTFYTRHSGSDYSNTVSIVKAMPYYGYDNFTLYTNNPYGNSTGWTKSSVSNNKVSCSRKFSSTTSTTTITKTAYSSYYTPCRTLKITACDKTQANYALFAKALMASATKTA